MTLMLFVTLGSPNVVAHKSKVLNTRNKLQRQCGCVNPKRDKRTQVPNTWVMTETTGVKLLNGEQKMEMKATKEVKVGERVSFCRCWKSAKHPYCDGSHNKYNKETGDHVGPIVVAAVQATE
jgi:CDGSH-type Zn-finger protein